LVHRLRELLEGSEQIPAGLTAAFVLCPVAFAMSAVQQAQAEFLYRIAFEQAQFQVAQTRRSRWSAFSLN